jgi:hypothetical protein
MSLIRTFTVLASAAVLLPVLPATAALAAPAKTWGPYSAPGGGARASGTLKATGEDRAVLPTADSVRITGRITDLTRSRKSCGWAVFRIAYRKGSNLPFYERYVRDCSYGSPKAFTRVYPNVYQVELKVCSEPYAAEPSLVCLSAGSWKVLYTSPH